MDGDGEPGADAYVAERLDHLGIVAGVCREIGLADWLDAQDERSHERVSVGTATVAMLLNGLGFSNRRLYLVSQFARRLLNSMAPRIPKAIFLDEAWAITSTPQGAKLIPEVSRMGRSRNTALILVSQNAGDLLNEQVTNCLSGVFAFRSSERVEVANVMALLGVEASDEHNAVLRGLGNGECIFRDLDGRAGRIGVDLITDDLRRWLDTNPTRARSPEHDAPQEAGSGAVAPGRSAPAAAGESAH